MIVYTPTERRGARNIKRLPLTLLCASILAAVPFAGTMAAPAPAPQAMQSGVKILLQRAKYWIANGREDLAVKAWKRVLLAQPHQPEATRQLALYYARHGDQSAARRLLPTLEHSPDRHAAQQVSGLLTATNASGSEAVNGALQSMQHGDFTSAVGKFRQAFGDKPPAQWADPYYQALSKSHLGDWQSAVAGARTQHAAHPNAAGFQLALGHLLAQHAATRANGIALLEDATGGNGPTARKATSLWRKALAWFGNDPAGIPYLTKYLHDHTDAALSHQLASMQQARAVAAHQSAFGHQLAAAYKSLSAGDTADAQRQFALLVRSHPKNVKAAEGLADVAMQRKDYASAAPAYHYAARLTKDPAEHTKLRLLEKQAIYASNMAAAKAAYQSGNLSTAMGLYKRVLAATPHDPGAKAALAAIYSQQGRTQDAAELFHELIAAHPAQLAGWMGQLNAYRQLDNPQGVQNTLDRMPPELREKARYRPDYASIVAWAQGVDGHQKKAIDTLSTAISALPAQQTKDLRVQRAWLYYNTHQDGLLFQALQQLHGESDLAPDLAAQVKAIYLHTAQREAMAAQKQGNTRAVSAILANLERAYADSDDTQRVRAALYVGAHQYAQAVKIYQSVGPEKTADGYRAAIGAALAAHANSMAGKWATQAVAVAPNDVDLGILAARAQFAAGHAERARHALIALRNRLPGAQGAGRQSAENAAVDTKQYPFAQGGGIAQSTPRGAPADDPFPFASNASDPRTSSAAGSAPSTIAMNAAQAAKAREAISSELADINGQTSPYVATTVYGRSRSGPAGSGRVSETAVQTHASVAIGSHTRVGVSVSSISLNAGTPTNANPTRRGKGGRIWFSPANYVKAKGVAIALTLHTPTLDLSLGTTPESFPVHSLVGRVKWSPTASPWSLGASREPIRDSGLSYAGVRDPLTGRVWGGVFANSLAVGYADGTSPWDYGYFNLQVGKLRGKSTQDNTRVILDAGFMRPLNLQSDTTHAAIGFDFLGMTYRHNSNHFSFGQGGYFSPSRYFRPSLAFKVGGKVNGHIAYGVNGRLGAQLFHQDSNVRFPTNLSREEIYHGERFANSDGSGIGFGLNAHVTWAWSNQLFVTGFGSIDNSNHYTDSTFGVRLIYNFLPTPSALQNGGTAKGVHPPRLLGSDSQ